MTEPCADYASLLVHAADGTIDALERGRLEVHLHECAACRAALADQQAVRAALAALPAVHASPFFAARVRSEINRTGRWTETIDFRWWTWRVAPLAAGLALAAFLVVRPTTTAASSSPSPVADLPVSAALWSDAVSDTSLLSLMLESTADASLEVALSETKP